MSVYAIGMITITDRARYQRYAEQFMPILRNYSGKFPAADERAKGRQSLCCRANRAWSSARFTFPAAL
ncbi:MAG: DUF1330 domain-containing protein [Bradyrhizobium sp.]